MRFASSWKKLQFDQTNPKRLNLAQMMDRLDVVVFLFFSFSDSGLRKERRRKKKVTNIISFDDDLDGGDEEEAEDDSQRAGVPRKSHAAPNPSSVEEGVDPLEPNFPESPAQNGLAGPGMVGWVGSPRPCRTAPGAEPLLSDLKGLDDEDEEEMYKPRTPPSVEDEKILADL